MSESPNKGMDVAYVAHLARMALEPDEVALFQDQLAHILEQVDKLSELDVSGVVPTAHARPLTNVFRDDIPAEGLSHDEIMANAPQPRSGLFVVPKILE